MDVGTDPCTAVALHVHVHSVRIERTGELDQCTLGLSGSGKQGLGCCGSGSKFELGVHCKQQQETCEFVWLAR